MIKMQEYMEDVKKETEIEKTLEEQIDKELMNSMSSNALWFSVNITYPNNAVKARDRLCRRYIEEGNWYAVVISRSEKTDTGDYNTTLLFFPYANGYYKYYKEQKMNEKGKLNLKMSISSKNQEKNNEEYDYPRHTDYPHNVNRDKENFDNMKNTNQRQSHSKDCAGFDMQRELNKVNEEDTPFILQCIKRAENIKLFLPKNDKGTCNICMVVPHRFQNDSIEYLNKVIVQKLKWYGCAVLVTPYTKEDSTIVYLFRNQKNYQEWREREEEHLEDWNIYRMN